MKIASAALVLVRAAALVVPADARAEWRRDWETELAWSDRGAIAQVWRALGAWPHAIWLRADRWRWDMIWQDIRYGARALVARPGFALVAMLTLALGIGANAAIFSAVRAVLLRPLPFPEAERLVTVSVARIGGTTSFGGSVSVPDFVDWRDQSHAFDGMAAVNEVALALTGDGPAEQVSGAQVTGAFFDVMGVGAARGRALTMADEAATGVNVVVLSDALWQRRYGSDPAIVGGSIQLDGVPYQVAGVMPAGFSHPSQSEFWTPLRFTADELTTQRGAHYLEVYARLKSGGTPAASLASAATEMRGIAARLAGQYPRTNKNITAAVVSLRDALVGDVRRPLWTLLAAVGAVLLIVCANVASLSLTRALGRAREFAIRASLGASRGRLARALVVESLLLSVAGAAVGLLLARWTAAGIALAGHHLEVPFLSETRIDGPVLLFAFALCLVTAVLCGTLPGWQLSARTDLARRMREDGGSTTADRTRLRVRGALIVAEAALAVLLLVGAGLLMRSFVGLTSVELGFNPDRVQKFDLTLPAQAYPTPAARAAFVDDLVARVSAEPGVERAGAIFGLPLTGFVYGITAVTMDGRKLTDEEQDGRSFQVRVVTPEYFRTMSIPIVRGRAFAPTDRLGAVPVAIVNEAAAAKFWPNESPIGHSVELGTRMGQGNAHAGGEIVGVAGDVHDFGPASQVRPTLYIAHAQFPVDYLSVVVRTREDGTPVIEPIRKLIALMDPALPIYAERTMRQLSAEAVAQRQLLLTLIGAFAVLAAVLAALGIYGLLAHAVGQRTREIGLRLALGAARGRVIRMVIGQALWLTAIGLAIGLVGAAAMGGLIRDLLFSTRPTDPVTYLGVAAAFLLVALVAAWLPARRAARIDPLAAIRSQ